MKTIITSNNQLCSLFVHQQQQEEESAGILNMIRHRICNGN